MSAKLILSILLMLVSVGLIAVGEVADRLACERSALRAGEQRLQAQAQRLEELLASIVDLNRELAGALKDYPAMPRRVLEEKAKTVLATQPRIASVVVSRGLQVDFVYPFQGNGAIVGMDFGLHPEFMDSIKRAIFSRMTAIDGPFPLMQTGRLGIVVRTALLDGGNDAAAFRGQVSLAADLEGLLLEAGLLSPGSDYTLAVRRRLHDKIATPVFGDPGIFQRQHVTAVVALPDGQWEIGAAPVVGLRYDEGRAWLIRSFGGVITFVLLACWLRYRGGAQFGRATGSAVAGAPRCPPVSLRTILLAAVLVPAVFVVGISGWLSYKASMDIVEQLERRQVVELASQLRERVSAFFDVPRRVAVFNAEQFGNGMLDFEDHERVLSSFLLQLRLQPLLTFLSMGTPDGEYVSSSRPPLGDDKALRVLHARKSDGRALKMFTVDDANRRWSPISVGNPHFDARTRPWFKEAAATGSVRWYPTYRYAVRDHQGLYDTLGIGMSAPLYDSRRQWVGVVAADVALSQVSAFLRSLMSDFGGIAFLAEQGGELLASSGTEPIYRLDGNNTIRIKATESENATIRLTGEAILESGVAEGHRFLEIGAERCLINWQTLRLPAGPALIIGFALPESRFAGPAEEALRSVSFLALMFIAMSVLFAVLVARWFAQPLQSLSTWVKELAAGDWQAPPPQTSPVREVSTLMLAFRDMAGRLHRHTEHLERLVAERTASLEEANRQLAILSATDCLTGIANRRRFDEAVASEWSRATRSGHPLAIILLDVDYFKMYNDRYGHQAGDAALRSVATVLADKARRSSDLCARIGGEEFAIVAANTDREAAQQMADSVRESVERLAIAHEGSTTCHVTASFGVVVMQAGSRLTTQQLLAKADAALYQAKSCGRNRVVMAAADPPDAVGEVVAAMESRKTV